MTEKTNKRENLIEYMGMLYGQGVPKVKDSRKKALGFVCLQRPLVAIMGPLMFFAAAFIALGRVPPLGDILWGFIAVYALTSAEHTIDDFIDKEIDKKKWPTRPLPTETISRRGGGMFAISLAALGIIISYIVFNQQLVIVEFVALGLGTAYPFLRDRLGYLVLGPIPPLIGIGGWVAYTPDTLLTSPVPWILYLIFFTWQAFHILTLPWALTRIKTFIIKPKPGTVAKISVVFSVITLILALYLSFFIPNAIMFVSVMIIISMLFWTTAVPLIKEPTKTENSYRAVMVATNYNVIMCIALMFAAI
ncbi:MAG: UbiA prenyltransferase family protein [Thermoplasmata archaeon]|nr:MAG: UbiA prenyltransferase family protein [Thermoplasmata archaeon]